MTRTHVGDAIYLASSAQMGLSFRHTQEECVGVLKVCVTGRTFDGRRPDSFGVSAQTKETTEEWNQRFVVAE
jgi:hypothetical protein